MMRVIGYGKMRIADIVGLTDKPPPDDLVDAIEAAGLIHEPIIRESDNVVVCGRRRIAAHKALSRDVVDVKFVAGSDDDVRLWTLQENAHRSDLTAKERQAMILESYEIIRRRREAEPVTPEAQPVKPKRGRPKRADAAVVAEVAATMNVTPRTVMEATAVPREVVEVERPAPVIDTYGLDFSDEWIESVRVGHAAVKEMQAMIAVVAAKATALLALIKDDKASYPANRAERLREELRKVGGMLASAIPTSVCWYCKGHADYYADCAACLATGVGLADAETYVPAELRDRERMRVAKDGKFVDMPRDTVATVEEDDPWA